MSREETQALSSERSWASRPPTSIDQFLLNLVDFGFAGVLLAAPWFMGGRHPLGQFVLAALSVAVAVAWITRQALAKGQTVWKISVPELLLLVAVALVVLQLTPLPSAVIAVLSPPISVLLPLWNPQSSVPDHLGSWDQLTLAPDATRAGLVMLLSYGLLFIVAVQRIKTIDDVERLLRIFAGGTIALASLGLLQYLTSNGKFLWIYDHPFRDTDDAVKGPYINKNHFAHMLALGLGPLIWSVQRAMTRVNSVRDPSFSTNGVTSADLEWLVMVHTMGLGIVLFAGLMTLSRGGILSMFVAMAVSIALLYRTGSISSRFLTTFGGVLVFIAFALTIHGFTSVTNRLDDFTAGSINELDQQGFRRKLWQADLSAARDFATFGTGIGSHRDVYLMYLPEAWDAEMTHAENGYLQVALEAGLPGLTLLLIGIGVAGYWCLESLRALKQPRVYAAAAAVASGLVASVVHSWVDFVWYISSCMAATTLLLACACRLMEMSREGRERWVWVNWNISRQSLAIAAALLVVVGGWMLNNRFRAAMASSHWDQYMAFVCSPDNEDGKMLPPETLLDHLRAVTRWTPDNGRAHVALAKLALQRFDEEQKHGVNPLALGQVREAAMASHFKSRQDLDEWLGRAIGEHRRYLDEALWHTRVGLAAAPLLGEGYLYLAELCFLENAQPETKAAYVAQALDVRPNSGDALLVAGKEAAFAGDWQSAVDYWKRSFKTSERDQAKLIELLAAGRVPVSFVIENFQPHWPTVQTLYKQFSPIVAGEESRTLREYYLAETTAAIEHLPDTQAAQVWYQLILYYDSTNQPNKSLECLRRALALDPNHYGFHRLIVTRLVQAEMWDEAAEQAEWCLQRRPNDKELKQDITQIAKARGGSGSRSAARSRKLTSQ